MTLPMRRKPVRSGIARAPRRVWPRHEKFVRGRVCCVPDCATGDRIEFAHVRSSANAGTGIKPPSWDGISLCAAHHREQHQKGSTTFGRKYGIDLWKLAAEFAARSPDLAMKAAMRDLGS